MEEGLFLLKVFIDIPEKSEIFKSFVKLDEKERELRVRADMIIDQGAMEEKTKEYEQKKQSMLSKKKFDEETEIVVVSKKMTQAEKKKLLKAQKNQTE